MIKPLSLSFSIVLMLFLCIPSFAQEQEVIITDMNRSSEIGINSEYLFITFTRDIIELTNDELYEKYREEYQQFIDSQGRTIISEPYYLSSNTISVPVSNIRSIGFNNGTFEVEYFSNPPLRMEELIGKDGVPLLNKFYIEDLEKIRNFYLKL